MNETARRPSWSAMVMMSALFWGCRPEPPAEPTSEVDGLSQPPQADPHPASSGEAEEPPAAATNDDDPVSTPASVRVDHLVGHPARWEGQTVFAVGRIVFEVGRCTRSEPPSCTGTWHLVDAKAAKPMRIVLDGQGFVPEVCRPAGSGIGVPSPCAPDELDRDAVFRVRGRFEYRRGASAVVVESLARTAD